MPRDKLPLSAVKAPVFWLLLVIAGSWLPAANTNSSQNRLNMCVDCHTDAKKIKSLYTPPDVEIKVEEGEG